MEQLLLFFLGERLYALEVGRIQEILDAPLRHYLPRAPRHFLGAVNFRGSILPLLDLAGFLGRRAAASDHRVIVLPTSICAVALAVTAVQGIIRVEEALLGEAAPAPGADLCSRGEHDSEGRKFHLLDLGQVIARLDKG